MRQVRGVDQALPPTTQAPARLQQTRRAPTLLRVVGCHAGIVTLRVTAALDSSSSWSTHTESWQVNPACAASSCEYTHTHTHDSHLPSMLHTEQTSVAQSGRTVCGMMRCSSVSLRGTCLQVSTRHSQSVWTHTLNQYQQRLSQPQLCQRQAYPSQFSSSLAPAPTTQKTSVLPRTTPRITSLCSNS